MPSHRTLDVPKVVPEGLNPRSRRSREESDPSLTDWVRVVGDGWKALVICVGIGLGVGLLATVLQSAQYRATGSVVVTPAKFLDPNSADQLPTLTNTVQRLAGTTAVLSPTARDYVRRSPDQVTRAQRQEVASPDWVAKHIRVAQQGDSSIIEISGVGATQRDASDLTRATVTTLARVVNAFDTRSKGAQTGGITIKVFTLAQERGQVSPTPVRNVLVGVNIGLIVGVVAALLLGMSRRRLRRASDISEELRAPVLAEIDVRGGALDSHPGFFEAAKALERTWGQDARGVVLVTGTIEAAYVAVIADGLVAALEKIGMSATLAAANRGATEVAEEDVLVQIRGGSRWSQPVPLAQPEARVPTLDQIRTTDGLIVVAGPSLDHPAEVAHLIHDAEHAVVVVHSGVSLEALRPARVLEPKIVGAIVIR